MTKLKHNKKRNTAFLYEALVRELTKAVLNEDIKQKEKIVSLLAEHFAKNTILHKELELYKALTESNGLHLHVAEKLLFETKREHSSLNKKKIFNEQSALISQINKNLTNKIFANFVPNYKNIATISQIFNNEDISVKKRVILEQSVVEEMVIKEDNSQSDASGMKPIDNIVFSSFVKNFNSEYDKLYQEQKNLLNLYISSFKDGGTELSVYLNEELGRLKNQVKSFLAKDDKENTISENKMKSLLEVMEGFKEQPVNKQMLQKVMKIQQLIKEINN